MAAGISARAQQGLRCVSIRCGSCLAGVVEDLSSTPDRRPGEFAGRRFVCPGRESFEPSGYALSDGGASVAAVEPHVSGGGGGLLFRQRPPDGGRRVGGQCATVPSP